NDLRLHLQDRQLPPGVGYMPKPWQPLNVLIAAEEALAPARQGLISAIRRLQTLRESVCQLSGQCPLSGGRGTQSQQHDVIGQEWRTRKGPGDLLARMGLYPRVGSGLSRARGGHVPALAPELLYNSILTSSR